MTPNNAKYIGCFMCPFYKKLLRTLIMLLQAAKYIGAGLATIGLAGAGVGIGTGTRKKRDCFVYKSIKNTGYVNQTQTLNGLTQHYFYPVYTFMVIKQKVFIVWASIARECIFNLIIDQVYSTVGWKVFVLELKSYIQALKVMRLLISHMLLIIRLTYFNVLSILIIFAEA